jgi:NAD-dependent SIR2 family protein deacetylase
MGDYSHFKGLRGSQTSQWKGDDASYRAAHARIVAARGKAEEHACVDCGGQAKDWSHRHGAGYSTHPFDYDPRCRKCHYAYDRPSKVA